MSQQRCLFAGTVAGMHERGGDRSPYAVQIVLEMLRLAISPALWAISLAVVTSDVVSKGPAALEPPMLQAAQVFVAINGFISSIVFGGHVIGWLVVCSAAVLVAAAVRQVVAGYHWYHKGFAISVTYPGVRFAARVSTFLLAYALYSTPPAVASSSVFPALMLLASIMLAALAVAAVITTESFRAQEHALSGGLNRGDVVHINDHITLEFTESWTPDQDLMVIADARSGHQIAVTHEDWVGFAVGIDAFHQAHCTDFDRS